MALTAHVVATFVGSTGGEVVFILSTPLVNRITNEIIESIWVVRLDSLGQIAVDLPVNGDPDLEPEESYWRVSHRLLPDGVREDEYALQLTMADVGQTVDLADRIGASISTPVYGYLTDVTSEDGSVTVTTPSPSVRNVSIVASGSVDKHYIHHQDVPDILWIITHGLGKHPAVTVVDSAGTWHLTGVEYPDLNTALVHTTAPFSGVAYCN